MFENAVTAQVANCLTVVDTDLQMCAGFCCAKSEGCPRISCVRVKRGSEY